jgi:hypothetical protein
MSEPNTPTEEEQNPETPEEQSPAETPAEEEQSSSSDEEGQQEEDQSPAEEESEEAPAEENPEDDEQSEETEDNSEYTSYEDPALKQVVRILEESEIPVAEANAIFMPAVESGDLSKINKQALVDRLGEDKADMVMVLAQSYYNTTFSEMKAIEQEAFKITGGEENYTAMQQWIADKAASDPEFAKDMEEFRSMVNTNKPRAVKAAITELFGMYRNDPNTTIEAEMEVGDSAPNAGQVEPLSRMEYAKEINKARRAGTYESVRASLWKRRQAGIKQGI